ncbi:heat shock protein 70 [Striga asiatica]|uniref:Heat shock protein 70 n=1 Tax=Striga asiatica TaxID=4170 RepID=A0A5A7R830_STRAF|nr:heat shock protein 70 [Striga asiatica]
MKTQGLPNLFYAENNGGFRYMLYAAKLDPDRMDRLRRYHGQSDFSVTAVDRNPSSPSPSLGFGKAIRKDVAMPISVLEADLEVSVGGEGFNMGAENNIEIEDGTLEIGIGVIVKLVPRNTVIPNHKSQIFSI